MAPYLKGIFTKLYEQKKKARKNGDDCLETLSKIMINSVYGWFGLNTHDKDSIVFTPPKSQLHYKYLDEGNLLSYSEWPNNNILRVK